MTIQESKAITFMRFPLALLVVILHTPHESSVRIEACEFLTLAWCINTITAVIEHIVAIAVPAFFLLSVFFNSYGLGKAFSREEWIMKLKSRNLR